MVAIHVLNRVLQSGQELGRLLSELLGQGLVVVE